MEKLVMNSSTRSYRQSTSRRRTDSLISEVVSQGLLRMFLSVLCSSF